MSERKVQGYCPMGCGDTLFLGSGGHITCSYIGCAEPDAVSTLLDDPETRHVVEFEETGFTIRHPIRERLRDQLMDCKFHEHVAALSGPPVKPGRYCAIPVGDSWRWEELRRG